MPISKWVHKLIDRVNGPDGEDGAEALVDHWPSALRVGRALRPRGSGFYEALNALLDRYEAGIEEETQVVDDLKKMRYPELSGRLWQNRLRDWMQAIYDAMGIKVDVPEVPKLSRNQRRAFQKYGLMVLFIPAILEGDYPGIKPNWGKYLTKSWIERIALPGRWVAIETIEKPNCTDKVYPNDQLMADIGVDSRFNHPHSGKGEGDDIVEDLLPKMGKKLLVTTDQTIDLQTAEIFNFVGNLFNFLTEHTADTLPNLGSTLSWEWCKNSYDSGRRVVVGGRDHGGLAGVSDYWRGCRGVGIGFRSLVVL